MLTIAIAALLKSRASGPEKASICNGNGATSDEHILHFAVRRTSDSILCECRLHVDAAGSEHLDSLLENDGLPTGSLTVPYEVGDGTSRGGAGCWVFPVVELHASVPVGAGGCIRRSDAVEELCIGVRQV